MIGELIDNMVCAFAPLAGARRMQARRVVKRYQGAESNRLNSNKKPLNRSADAEMLGPFGADAMRAWARLLVRDNAYAWGVVDTIVSSVVGTGIKGQSQIETPAGEDRETVNEARDRVWNEWCRVCDVNGQYTLYEMQAIVQREIVEAGECLIHLVDVPLTYRGINRPVPLALELIEADRLASDRDTYNVARDNQTRIVRGIELDDLGKPVAYHVYRSHPNDPFAFSRDIERIPAKDILHLFKRDRIGQTRGISWFAPVCSWLKDLATYVDNELQASAVASCFTVAVKSSRGVTGLGNPSVDDDETTTDKGGNSYDFLQPGMIMHLLDGESIESANPGRPNSAAEPWINLMLRGIAVGTGLSYEIVARDYSKTSYSSSRTSQLEDRRRFRRWQRYLIDHLCEPIHDRFSEAAALAGRSEFPTMTEILEDREKATAFTWTPQEWEWVDPQNEQSASEASIKANQSTYQEELGSRGRNWRNTFYQRAKEEKLRKALGLLSIEEQQPNQQQQQAGTPQSISALALSSGQIVTLLDIVTRVGTGSLPHETAKAIVAVSFPEFESEVIDAIIDPIKPGSIAADGVPAAATPMDATESTATAEMMGLSTLQWNRNVKAIRKILDDLKNGVASAAQAQVFLSSVGMKQTNIDALIADAADGQLDAPLPTAGEPAAAVGRSEVERGGPGSGPHPGTGGGEKKVKARTKAAPMSEKAQRAKAAHKMVDATVQQEADKVEREFAKSIGGASFENSEPVDVVVADKSGRVAHGIEHKYVQDNANDKITMNKYAQVRKVVWEQKNKADFHTVVETKSGETYYRRGVGSFRIGGMHKVTGGKAELKQLMNTHENKLPAGAMRTDSKIRVGTWKQAAGSRDYVNSKTGETVSPKK